MGRTLFGWGVVLVLFLTFAAQLVMWRNLREEENTLSAQNFTAVTQQHQQLRAQIDRAKERVQQLESVTLWGQPHQMLPLLGKVANQSSVKLVGVEELPLTRKADYQAFPLRLTFSGNYESFATFLATVGKINPLIRIDGLRIYQREQYPDTLWMSLTVAPMYREDVQGTSAKLVGGLTPDHQSTAPLTFGRDAFAYGVDEASVDSQVPQDPEDVIPSPIPLPTLTGILWNEKQPYALFTDHQQRSQRVSVNESIADATVIQIQPQSVVLKRGKETYELRLWESNKSFSVRSSP